MDTVVAAQRVVYVSHRVFASPFMLNGNRSLVWLIAMISGMLVMITVGTIIGLYRTHECMQRYFNEQL